jgi:thiamine phosphate synthase YjbQ (UPF0047 family)
MLASFFECLAGVIAVILPERVTEEIADLVPEPSPVFNHRESRNNDGPAKIKQHKAQCESASLCRSVLTCLCFVLVMLAFSACHCTTEDNSYVVNEEGDFPATSCDTAFALESVLLLVHKYMDDASQFVVSNFCRGPFKDVCLTKMSPIVEYLQDEKLKLEIKTWSHTVMHEIANKVMNMLAEHCPVLQTSMRFFVKTNTLALIKQAHAKNDKMHNEMKTTLAEVTAKRTSIENTYAKNQKKLAEIKQVGASMKKLFAQLKVERKKLRL